MKVRLDHHPNYWGKYKSHVPNHQPDISLTIINHYQPLLTTINHYYSHKIDHYHKPSDKWVFFFFHYEPFEKKNMFRVIHHY